MGYSTSFTGRINIKPELKASEICLVQEILNNEERKEYFDGERDYKLRYIDYKLTDDYQGLEWNGAEKSYEMTQQLGYVITAIQKDVLNVTFSGELKAQGEEHDDKWILRVVDNNPIKIETPTIGDKVTCPCCGDEFRLEGYINDNK